MSRRVVVASVALVACLATLWATVSYVLKRDREQAERELADDRLQTLTSAGRALGVDLAGIGKDLALAATLAADAKDTEGAENAIRAVAAVRPQYVVIDARPDTSPPARATMVDLPAGVLALAPSVIERMIEAAQREPGELHISPGLSSADDVPAWYRVFATRPRDARVTIAAVVDMRRLVVPPELLRIGPSRLLVMSAHGVPAPASDPAVTAAVGREPATGRLHRILDLARARQANTAILDAEAAADLGLPSAAAVAAAVPIPIDAGAPWVLMLVTSTATLDARHRALVRRVALDAGIGLVLVLGVVAYVVRNARRSAALHEQLRHAELLAHLIEKAEKILDHIPSGVLALDEHDAVSACNQFFAAKRSDLVGRPLSEVFVHAPSDHLRAVVELVSAARRSGEPRTLRRGRLALLGAERYLTIHAIPLANRFRDVATLMVIDDESALQKAEDGLLRSEKLATAGQLAAGIAHEIGSPLGVARGRAQMVLLRGSTDALDTKSLTTIIDRIDYVSRLIEQLLDYLRPRVARVQRVDTARSLRIVADLLEPAASARSVTLAVDSGAQSSAILADPFQLQQVLVNLVMNAIDACEQGGTVTMCAKPHPGSVVLEVADDGRGIAAEDRTQVFDPFFTTKKRGQGTGLGLWVVAQVARAHEAEIEVDSRPGRGSTFRLVWPAAEPVE